MAIVLNRGNMNPARTSLFETENLKRGPSVSVWEPSVRESRVNNVRTLSASSRTVRRNGFEHRPSEIVTESPESVEGTASVRSNLALGAVFGAALFLGTLFAGLNAPEESISQGMTVSSSPAHGEVSAR